MSGSWLWMISRWSSRCLTAGSGAVDSVSLDLCQGETLGVVGESGAGKSVLLRSIMGLMHPQIASREGSVRFEGRELVGLPRRELRRLWGTAISVVFQDPMSSLNPVVRIGRQIGESVRPTEDGRRVDVRERSLELLRLVGIPEPRRRLRRYPHELSGGMRQRVAIAIALAGRPRMLLADEPTTSLDVTVQAQILDLLAELQDRLNMAMILGVARLGRHCDENRQDRRDVRRAGRGARADQRSIPVDADALHGSSDPLGTEARRLPRCPVPHHRWTSSRSSDQTQRLPVCAALPVRAAALSRRATSACRGRHPGPLFPLLVPGGYRRRTRSAGTQYARAEVGCAVNSRAPRRKQDASW